LEWWNGVVWTWLVCLRIEKSGGLFWIWYEPWGSIKCRRNYQVA
jgi:hypothetical protein